ncbi:MAG: VWA domain-containing protein [Bacteroidota bacterium]|nr:VWA domain-containing protein [Bacteroidota bacterium]
MLYDWFRNIDFAYPLVFGLFVLVPVMIWWYVKKYQSRQASILVSTAQSFTGSSLKNSLRHLPFILRLLAISCLVVALARPQERNDQELTKGEGIDIVLSMDVSGSMLSKDFEPNRLEAAKEVASEFVRSRPVDRIGLVIFSGESFTQCPITTDKNALLTQIEGLRSGMLQDGTVIGEGLATAVDRLSKSLSKSKVIILLTDGKEEPPENRLIDPLTALEIAKAQPVKVYTVGMALEGYVPVEEKTRKGVQKKMRMFLDEDLLKRIASETGGQYFRARDKNGLSEIYSQIDKLEKSKIDISSFKRYQEKFLPFVIAALALLFFEIVLRFTIFKKFP